MQFAFKLSQNPWASIRVTGSGCTWQWWRDGKRVLPVPHSFLLQKECSFTVIKLTHTQHTYMLTVDCRRFVMSTARIFWASGAAPSSSAATPLRRSNSGVIVAQCAANPRNRFTFASEENRIKSALAAATVKFTPVCVPDRLPIARVGDALHDGSLQA